MSNTIELAHGFVLPTDANSWAAFLTPILIGLYIALDRLSVWKTRINQKVTQEKIDSVHVLVNGKSEAATAKINELTAANAELKQSNAALVAALAGKVLAPVTKEGTEI